MGICWPEELLLVVAKDSLSGSILIHLVIVRRANAFASKWSKSGSDVRMTT